MRLRKARERILLTCILFSVFFCKGESMNSYHCIHCGKEIFKSEDIIKEVRLWDLKEYQADCYMVKKITDIDSFKRFDASLHEGWYCCRFIAMRMIQDKFGTGRELLVYKDSVEVSNSSENNKNGLDKTFVRLTLKDFDHFISSVENKNKLVTIKFGAIWCPPCRLMDSVFSKIIVEKKLPDVVFSEVDIDEEKELAEKFPIASIPFTIFFYNGKRVSVNENMYLGSVENALVGGFREKEFIELSAKILTTLR
jgi:thiol-disulfide isomerase/thioredoxin